MLIHPKRRTDNYLFSGWVLCGVVWSFIKYGHYICTLRRWFELGGCEKLSHTLIINQNGEVADGIGRRRSQEEIIVVFNDVASNGS